MSARRSVSCLSMPLMRWVCIFICSFALLTQAYAVIETRELPTVELEERYQALIEELRCLVCQNQNLAESDADLAKDLRDKTVELLIAGNTDDQIREFMRSRYGDFVLYRPPFDERTAFLWLAPIVLLLLVPLFVYLRFNGSNKKTSVLESSSAELAAAKQALRDEIGGEKIEEPRS
ncbi:MAG: cytochrome c-type biogenesis protein [Pseudomonadota bacterium]